MLSDNQMFAIWSLFVFNQGCGGEVRPEVREDDVGAAFDERRHVPRVDRVPALFVCHVHEHGGDGRVVEGRGRARRRGDCSLCLGWLALCGYTGVSWTSWISEMENTVRTTDYWCKCATKSLADEWHNATKQSTFFSEAASVLTTVSLSSRFLYA